MEQGLPANSGRVSFWRRLAVVLLTLLVAEFWLIPSMALAQERATPFDILKQIFRPQDRGSGRSEEQRQPPAVGRQRQSPPANRQRQPRRTVVTTAEPAAGAAMQAPVGKRENAGAVLVVGDFLAAGLAESLTNVFADAPNVRIVDHTNGSSGFVRDDFYDWPEQIGTILDAETPSVVVVMIGSNDRQKMTVDGRSESVRSEAWTKEYEARIEAFTTAISESDIPLIWVGMPAFKSNSMSSDMLAFNDIYRRAAEKANGVFVDIWDGFVDEGGSFVTTGPDINGQPVQLRARDGINLTRDGKRKVAFYAEKPLNRILGDAVSPETGSLEEDALPAFSADPRETPTIERTLPISLNDPELDGGTELLGATPKPERNGQRSPADRLAVEGLAPAAKPGRADDFTWQREPSASE
jgi:hypothetical protein